MNPTHSIPAKNYTRNPAPTRAIRLIVLHSTEGPEREDAAISVARYFAGTAQVPAPQASAHYVVDSSNTVRCVYDYDVAWAAPGANRDGLHVELVGYAGQDAGRWADAYSLAMLERAAELVADRCALYRVPMVALDSDLVLAGRSGITTHAAVSAAYRKSSHWDPGPAFPMAWFIERVRFRSGGTA